VCHNSEQKIIDDNWSVLVHHRQYCAKIIKQKGESLVCCSQIYFAQNPCCVCKNVLALHWLKADVSRSNNVYSRSCFCLFKGVCVFLGVTGTKHVSACHTCTTCTHSELKIIEIWKHDSWKHKKVNAEIWSKGIQHCTHKNLYFYVIILSWHIFRNGIYLFLSNKISNYYHWYQDILSWWNRILCYVWTT
jgi:hypothetical protein